MAATNPTAPLTTAPTFPAIFLSAAPVNAAGGPDAELGGGAAAAASLEDAGIVLAASLEEEVSAAAEEEDSGGEAVDDSDPEELELAGLGFATPPETVVGHFEGGGRGGGFVCCEGVSGGSIRIPIPLVQYNSLITISLSLPYPGQKEHHIYLLS
jgi:hypothetical protein